MGSYKPGESNNNPKNLNLTEVYSSELTWSLKQLNYLKADIAKSECIENLSLLAEELARITQRLLFLKIIKRELEKKK